MLIMNVKEFLKPNTIKITISVIIFLILSFGRIYPVKLHPNTGLPFTTFYKFIGEYNSFFTYDHLINTFSLFGLIAVSFMLIGIFLLSYVISCFFMSKVKKK